jgi:protein-S-isoprenylcysteine O-methyltransferase Ste14
MKRNANEYLHGILNLAAGVGVVLLSFLSRWIELLCLPISTEIAKPVGLFIVYTGMSVVIWAAVHIKSAFLGEVEPKLDKLVQSGPYRLVRHPVYLGMTVALAGIPILLRSGLGLIGVLVLFLPSEIYRARLEEKALFHKFGNEWIQFATRTGFIMPLIGKAKNANFRPK